MSKLGQFTTCGFTAIALAVSASTAFASKHSDDDANYCMDVIVEPFHMDMNENTGACTVKDYLDGELQDDFYPFTQEEHLFNCDYFGPMTPLKFGDGTIIKVPSSVSGVISGTIDGYPFEADLFCASLTNWYQDSCADPDDPTTCAFQLAQPFLKMNLPFPRVTEVSVFDGVIEGENGKEIPILMATRAAGIMHLEDLVNFEIGASVTHSLLGLATYEKEDDEVELETLGGTIDLLLQGHIFSPDSVEDDPGAAVIKGSICSKDLYKELRSRGDRGRDDD
ncbi:MAG: hypothetical protein QNJ78_01410 [Gammaproteobacteria bacterium]|nr:hypothetical protein [Gammaproteobacteria bacterium]